MQAVIINDEKEADWDEFVETNPDVISWHKYDWYKVLKRAHNIPYYPIAVYDGSKICGILPLYEISTFRTGKILMSIPYVVAGGIVAPEEEVRQLLLKKAVELSTELQAPLTLKQYRTKVNGDFLVDDSYFNLEKTLSPNSDEIWEDISEENRRKIEEASSLGLTMEYPASDFNSFYKLLSAHQQSLGIPCQSKSWVKYLVDTNMYKMALLKLGGVIVAASMAKTFKDTVSFPMSCYDPKDQKGELYMYELYWKLMKQLGSEGIRISHSGRIPDSKGVPAFRLGWGGKANRYYYQYYGAGEKTSTESSSKRGRKREIFVNVWSKLPMPIINLLGPVIIKQLP